jgi:hypothetical protein
MNQTPSDNSGDQDGTRSDFHGTGPAQLGSSNVQHNHFYGSRAAQENDVGAPSPPRSGKWRGLAHRFGYHGGNWEYDHPGSCERTKRCDMCEKVMHDRYHQFQIWQWVEPRRDNNCLTTSTCERCGTLAKEISHDYHWEYLRKLEIPTNQIMYTLLKKFSRDPCLQIFICPHCWHIHAGTRTAHEWDHERQICTVCRVPKPS